MQSKVTFSTGLPIHIDVQRRQTSLPRYLSILFSPVVIVPLAAFGIAFPQTNTIYPVPPTTIPQMFRAYIIIQAVWAVLWTFWTVIRHRWIHWWS